MSWSFFSYGSSSEEKDDDADYEVGPSSLKLAHRRTHVR